MISIDIPARSLTVEVSDDEMERRKTAWQRPARKLFGRAAPLCSLRLRGRDRRGTGWRRTALLRVLATASGSRSRPVHADSGATEMKAARVILEALKREGVDTIFGFPGGSAPPPLRRTLRFPGDQPHPGPARAGRRPRRRRLRPGFGQGGRLHGHLRSRRHQPGDAHRQRLHGQRAHGGHHRPGEPPPHRAGLLPGGRRHRHHPADRQAQLPGQGLGRHPAHHPGGLLHRRHRAPRAGGHRHPGGRHQRRHGVRPRRSARDAACPATSPPSRGIPSRSGRPRASSPRPSARSSTPVAGSSSPAPPTNCGRWRSTATSRWPPRSPARAASPRTTNSPWAWWACTALRYANYALSQADLIFAVGVRFDDRVTGKLEAFAPHATFIHVDVDPAEISKNVAIDVPIVGDAKRVLAALVEELKKLDLSPDRHLPWMEQVEAWKRDHPADRPGARERRDHARVGHQQDLGGHRAATPWSAPRWASTRCGRPSTTSAASRGASSAPPASAPWASASRRPSGRRWHAPGSWWWTSPATARSR